MLVLTIAPIGIGGSDFRKGSVRLIASLHFDPGFSPVTPKTSLHDEPMLILPRHSYVEAIRLWTNEGRQRFADFDPGGCFFSHSTDSLSQFLATNIFKAPFLISKYCFVYTNICLCLYFYMFSYFLNGECKELSFWGLVDGCDMRSSPPAGCSGPVALRLQMATAHVSNSSSEVRPPAFARSRPRLCMQRRHCTFTHHHCS